MKRKREKKTLRIVGRPLIPYQTYSTPWKMQSHISIFIFLSPQYMSYSFPHCGQNHPRKHLNLVDAFLRQKRIEGILTKIPKAKILTNTEENKIKFIYIYVSICSEYLTFDCTISFLLKGNTIKYWEGWVFFSFSFRYFLCLSDPFVVEKD